MKATQELLTLYQQYQQAVQEHLQPWANQKHRQRGERQLQYQQLIRYLTTDINLLEQLAAQEATLQKGQWDSLRTHYYHRDHPLEFMPEVPEIANIRSAIFQQLQTFSF